MSLMFPNIQILILIVFNVKSYPTENFNVSFDKKCLWYMLFGWFILFICAAFQEGEDPRTDEDPRSAKHEE